MLTVFLLFIRYQIDRCCLRKNPFSNSTRDSIFAFAQQIVHSSEISFNEKRKKSMVDTIKIKKNFNSDDPQNFVFFKIGTGVGSLHANAWYIS